MNVGKLEEILKCLSDKEADVVFDTYRSSEEYLSHIVYDLVNVGIEHKNDKTMIKLAFEERPCKDTKQHCRIKNMNIKALQEVINE